MLHIHNGDCSAQTARKASLPGEHLAWRESLITGPTPADLSGDEWRKLRARHLSGAYGRELQECEQDLLSQEKALASSSKHDEVVLWFEHDLYCQLHLVYLLNWFSAYPDLAKTRLGLICIGEFPGKENFRGLGELSPKELASLFPGRKAVTDAELRVATSAWRAYSSPDPTAVEKFLETNTSSLPFLAAALKAHLRRFPSTTNGLSQIENRALKLVQQGLNSFSQLFPKFVDAEAVYGFGDAQLWLALHRLSSASQPLLKLTGTQFEPGQQSLAPEMVQSAQFEITPLGEAVVKGEADFVALNGIDFWLGGAYLHDEGFWRWNEQSRLLEFAQTTGL